MDYDYITLDEIEKRIKEIEEKTAEPKEVTDSISRVSDTILECIRSGKNIKIVSDYDADGITSAYILNRTIKAADQNASERLEVIINDRRNPYGVPKDLKPVEDSRYIILDMGCNDLEYIQNIFGKDTVIIDHHLIEDDDIRSEFRKNKHLLDPHSMKCEDGESSDYCAAGLAYRVYQTLKERGELTVTEKTDNSVKVMACIGTLADMVNVVDVHSYNRRIIKEGMECINNADINNLDFLIGYMLTKNSFGLNDCTSHDIAFFAAFLNSGGRCSEYIKANGAQMTYDAISGEDTLENCRKLDKLCEINKMRKGKMDEFMADNIYSIFISDELSKKPDTNICVYLMPENTPSAFCGLMASKLCTALNKAAVALTFNAERQTWTGSARNVAGQSSIYRFMHDILEKPEAKPIEMKYGGHENAFGITSLNNAFALINLIDQYHELLEPAPSKLQLLDIEPQMINSEQTIQQIKRLEPMGTGFQLPLIKMTGIEKFRNANFIKNRKDWKKIKLVADDDVTYVVQDWAWHESKVPQKPVTKAKNEISVLAELTINTYKGKEMVDLSAVFDRNFYRERLEEIEQFKAEKAEKANTLVK